MLRAIDVGIGDNADGHAGNSNAHYCKAEASDAALSAFFTVCLHCRTAGSAAQCLRVAAAAVGVCWPTGFVSVAGAA